MWTWLAALALAAAPPPAGPDGVFDRLFGEEAERPDASADARAGRDDLALVGLTLGGLKLVEDLAAYKTPEGLCLPVDEVLDALEIAHAPAPDGGETLRLFAPARTRTIAAASLRASPRGRCLTLAGWGRALPARFGYDEANLRVLVEADEAFPVALRREREERRRTALREGAPARPTFPAAANPWRWFALPTFDVALSGDLAPGGVAARATVEASGDLLKTTARVRLGLDSTGTPDLRLFLARTGLAGELPLGLRAIEAGDIAAPAQPLLADPAAGRGLILTTRPAWRADLFDRIELRGPLAPGWEAELHCEDQLLAVVKAADPAGDWVFPDVPLRTGQNRLIVRLFGPHGEVEERVFVRMVGAELNPENETSVTVGLIEPDRPLLGPARAPRRTAAAFASVEHGLSPALTARIDLRAPLGGGAPGVSGGLHAGLLGGLVSLLVASDGQGRPPLALRAGRRFGTADLRIDFADHGSAPSPDAPADVREFARAASLSLGARLPLGRRSAPVQLLLSRAETRAGETLTRLDGQLALAIGPTRLQTRLGAEWRAEGLQMLSALGGHVAAGGWRLRAGVDYRLAPAARIEQLQISASRASPYGQVTADAGWDFRRGGPMLTLGGSRQLGPFSLGGFAGLAGGTWRAGLSLGFSLFRADGGYRLGRAGLSRTGALRPVMFVDEDGDGRRSAVEAPVAGGRFLVDSSLRPERTGADGTGLIPGLSPGRPVELEPQLAALPDLSLRPVQPGATARLRPGQVLDLPVPLHPTGEVEARVLMRRNDTETPLAGVAVLLSGADGKARATTITDFDGYAYFDGVPFGSWTVAIAGSPDASAPVQLDRKTPSQTGLRLWHPVRAAEANLHPPLLSYRPAS